VVKGDFKKEFKNLKEVKRWILLRLIAEIYKKQTAQKRV
jgi:hypothetical protein